MGGAGVENKTYAGLTCYDIERETGKPVEKGVITNGIGPGGGYLAASPDGKDLYFYNRAGGRFLSWMKIGADGTPSLAGQATGPGVGANFRMSPDGKNIYSIGENKDGLNMYPTGDDKIGIFERKPSGELVYKKVVPLDVLGFVSSETTRTDFCPTIAGISPDGGWLYVAISNPKFTTRCFFGIFKRDPGGVLSRSRGLILPGPRIKKIFRIRMEGNMPIEIPTSLGPLIEIINESPRRKALCFVAPGIPNVPVVFQ